MADDDSFSDDSSDTDLVQQLATMYERGLPSNLRENIMYGQYPLSNQLHVIMSQLDFAHMQTLYPVTRSDAVPNVWDSSKSGDLDPDMPALMSDSDSSDSDDSSDPDMPVLRPMNVVQVIDDDDDDILIYK
jgi:hypothetical protein